MGTYKELFYKWETKAWKVKCIALSHVGNNNELCLYSTEYMSGTVLRKPCILTDFTSQRNLWGMLLPSSFYHGKLRFREVKKYLKVTQLVNGRMGIWAQIFRFRVFYLLYYSASHSENKVKKNQCDSLSSEDYPQNYIRLETLLK